MEVRLGKVLGKLGGVFWGQVHEFLPDEQETVIKKGRLVVAIEVEVTTEQSPDEVGRELLFRINETYYGSEVGVLESLKKTVEIVKEEFVGAKVICGVVMENRVYLAANNGGVWIDKNGKLGWIIAEKDTEEKGEVYVSGRVALGERIIMGTDEFWNKLMIEELVSGEKELDVEAKRLEDILHKGVGGVGAIIDFGAVKASQAKSVEVQEQKTVQMIDGMSEAKQEEEFNESIQQEVELETENQNHNDMQLNQEKRFSLNSRSFKDRIVDVAKKVKESMKIDEVYVVEQPKESYRKIVLSGIVFLAIFLIVFVAGRIRNQSLALKNDVGEKQIELIVHQYNEAKGLVGMNRDRSKELLDNVNSQIATLTAKQLEDKRILEVKTGIGEVLGAASGTLRIVLKQVTDLGLNREGAVASVLVGVDGGGIGVLDKPASRVFLVKPATGAVEVLLGKEGIGSVKMISSYPGKIVAISDKGIVDCEVVNKKCITGLVYEEVMGSAVDVKMWAGNVYLLTANRVVKYPVVESGYGAASNWLSKDEDELVNATSVAIDGNVWLVQRSGGSSVVTKFVGGIKEEFYISGLDRPMGERVIVETSENVERLYLLDVDNKRVVVVNKTGEFVEQWVSDDFGQATSLLVDSEGRKVYFAKGGGVYMYESQQ